jgi:hypothetical protein
MKCLLFTIFCAKFIDFVVFFSQNYVNLVYCCFCGYQGPCFVTRVMGVMVLCELQGALVGMVKNSRDILVTITNAHSSIENYVIECH